tara:strand:- start:327 stop:782 length:456 start_codon:yes stop_codon:yes gene_type:complete
MSEIDYSNACIYKIQCKDPSVIPVYVGSTTDIRKRRNTHRSDCQVVSGDKYDRRQYQFIREHGGFDNWELIKLADIDDCMGDMQLRMLEQEYMDAEDSILNIQRACKSKELIAIKKNAATTCPCGHNYTYTNRARHYATEPHKLYMEFIAV